MSKKHFASSNQQSEFDESDKHFTKIIKHNMKRFFDIADEDMNDADEIARKTVKT